MDEAFNIGFFAFHSAWIFFNCVGWIWRQTRRLHIATVTLTVLSWFGLGIWYGWGYCPCTDWHWQVRARLGHSDPPSYIQLMIDEVLGVDVSPNTADTLALVTLTAVTVISIRLNLQDWRATRRRH